jgi:diketogulonate reductase-like aldo/keto reductase
METIEFFGERLPRIGFGTWDIRGDSGLEALNKAIEIGYRHFDTAEMYRNEEIVGEAVAGSGVSREDFFITTKAWSDNLTLAEIKRACEGSLQRLDLEYVDLFLIHRPGSAPLKETLGGMQDLVSEGKVRFIGVSNFSVEQLRRSITISDEPIFTDQVEYHPYRDRDKLLEICRQNGAALTAYTPFAQGRVSRDRTINSIAKRHGKTPAQVVLRWLIQQDNVITIPKASSEKHQRENLDIYDFELSQEEMQAIDQLR